MARYRKIDYQRYIEADNGFGWTREGRASILSVIPSTYTTMVLRVVYRLEKFRDPQGEHGWYLYSEKPAHFTGEYCGPTLLTAIDEASKLIAEADLRGEGYERVEKT